MPHAKSTLTCRRGRTERLEPAEAVRELREAVEQTDPAAVYFFATARTDFPELARQMADAFDCPTIGCTTAGEITSEQGHTEGGIVAVSIASPRLRVKATTLGVCDRTDPAALQSAVNMLLAERQLGLGDRRCFATLIADGLSMHEERLAAGISAALGGIPLVGGSAGDDLGFVQTQVALNGHTHSSGGVLAIIETDHPFEIFHAHHFRPREQRLVITEADPATRRVIEIDGMPAVEGYARAVGVTPDRLGPRIYSSHPVMLRVGGQHYVRSIQSANPDGSLTFYCAIDHGLVLRIGEGHDMADHLRQQTDRLRSTIPDLRLTIGFDCVLRRLELLDRGLKDTIHHHLRHTNFIGFSTYGEQINSLHVNQTITGVALGNAA